MYPTQNSATVLWNADHGMYGRIQLRDGTLSPVLGTMRRGLALIEAAERSNLATEEDFERVSAEIMSAKIPAASILVDEGLERLFNEKVAPVSDIFPEPI